MDKFEYVNELLPFYEGLLTERQKEILQYYYYEDLSLSEIAENLAISRNAVYDSLNKSVKLLVDYESKLKLHEEYAQRMALYGQLKGLNDESVNVIVDELIKLED